MRPKPQLIGQVFGRLTVIGEAERSKHNHIQWYCECSCGKVTIVTTACLKTGNTISCGCYGDECRLVNARTHGMRRTKVYVTWCQMIARCLDQNSISYKNYGGRGISICDRWRQFNNFFADMGDRPFKNAQIDRIDNEGNYEPGNCKWSTPAENALNRRSTRYITYNGETLAIAQWTKRFGIARSTLQNRLNRGWSVEKALTESPKPINKAVF